MYMSWAYYKHITEKTRDDWLIMFIVGQLWSALSQRFVLSYYLTSTTRYVKTLLF